MLFLTDDAATTSAAMPSPAQRGAVDGAIGGAGSAAPVVLATDSLAAHGAMARVEVRLELQGCSKGVAQARVCVRNYGGIVL